MKRLANGTLKGYTKDELIGIINSLYDEIEIIATQKNDDEVVDTSSLEEILSTMKPIKFGLISNKTTNLIHEDLLKELQSCVEQLK